MSRACSAEISRVFAPSGPRASEVCESTKGTGVTAAACCTSSKVPWATSTTMPSRLHSRIDVGAERAQAAPARVLGLLVAQIARHVVHELEVPDPAGVHLAHPLEAPVHELAALDVADQRGAAGHPRRLQVVRGQHAGHPVLRDQGVHEREPPLGVRLQLARERVAVLADAPAADPAGG